MGGKYEVRWKIKDEFVPYQTEYTNNIIEFVKLLITNRGKIIYITIRF